MGIYERQNTAKCNVYMLFITVHKLLLSGNCIRNLKKGNIKISLFKIHRNKPQIIIKTPYLQINLSNNI